MGNANAALARSNFARSDSLASEFLQRLIRLAGEDYEGALLDTVFNEDTAVKFVNSLIEEVDRSEFDSANPDDLALGFQMILQQSLVRAPPPVVRQSVEEDQEYFDDMYDNDDHDNRAPSTHAANDSDEDDPDFEDNLPKHPDDLIDDEAEEVPEGEESSEGGEEGEEDFDEDEEEDEDDDDEVD